MDKRILYLYGRMGGVCNNCKYLSVTEAEQNRLHKLGIEKVHICNKYGKRVFHMSARKYHDLNIYPCQECKQEGGK